MGFLVYRPDALPATQPTASRHRTIIYICKIAQFPFCLTLASTRRQRWACPAVNLYIRRPLFCLLYNLSQPPWPLNAGWQTTTLSLCLCIGQHLYCVAVQLMLAQPAVNIAIQKWWGWQMCASVLSIAIGLLLNMTSKRGWLTSTRSSRHSKGPW